MQNTTLHGPNIYYTMIQFLTSQQVPTCVNFYQFPIILWSRFR